MIVGFGNDRTSHLSTQTAALKDLLRRLPIEGAVHRGEAMIHNVIRSVYPLIPIHVMPIIGKYSSIASQPLPQFPQTIIYEAASATVVNNAIMKMVWGIVHLGEVDYMARERSIPVILIWPNGKVTLERNEL